MKTFPMNQLAGAELTNWQSYEEFQRCIYRLEKQLMIRIAKHLLAESEAGNRSRRDSNAQVKIAYILVDFIGSNIQLFHRYHLRELAGYFRLVFL
jgi:hypothetical protein